MLAAMARLRRFPVCGTLAAALIVAGCASSPAPVVDRSIGGSRVAAAPASVAAARPGSYVVQPGDTLYSIAFRHGFDYRDVARWNGIDAPYTIHPGQTLRLTAPAEGRVARVSPAPPARPPAVAATRPVPPPAVGVFEPVPASPQTAPTAPSSAPVRTAPAPAAVVPSAATPPSAASSAPGATRSVDGVTWRWPADGALLSRFQGGDPTRQGIDIAGKSGDPVRAAADGVVVYSGNGLIGYGELIIVKHSDSYLSAYGHNRRRLVKEGDRVAAGQQIAEMGASGAPRDELHFEVRRDGKPVDPLGFLPPR